MTVEYRKGANGNGQTGTDSLYQQDRLNPHERIRNIGGVNNDGTRWKWSQQKTIEEIESGEWQFYVSGGGQTAKVIVAKHNGNKYIKTEVDGVHPDNLLALPECP